LEAKRPKALQCVIQQSCADHEEDIRRNPYHTTFIIDKDSYQYYDLCQNTGIPLEALADGLMGRKTHLPLRVKEALQKNNERRGATSLIKLYRDGFEKERMEEENKKMEKNEQESKASYVPGKKKEDCAVS